MNSLLSPAAEHRWQKFACTEPECSLLPKRRTAFFASAKAFAAHMVAVHGKKPFGCEVCGARYNKKVQQSIHKPGYMVTPSSTFSTHLLPLLQLDLDEHLASRHSEDGEPKIPCDVCGKRFFNASRLQYHRRDQHEVRAEDRAARSAVTQCDVGRRELTTKRLQRQNTYVVTFDHFEYN